MFVVEIDLVEAIRSNQKVHELKPKFTPTAVAAFGSTVAIGAEVCSAQRLEIIQAQLQTGPEGLFLRMGRQSPVAGCRP